MRDLQYKVYMSDSLFLYFAKGKAHSERFIDALQRKSNSGKEMTFNEIVDSVLEHSGITMIKE